MIEESKNQLLVAERYLRALRMAYPEVMASVRTKQVAQEMLLVKEAYVHELKASGKSVQWCMPLRRVPSCHQQRPAADDSLSCSCDSATSSRMFY